MTKQQFNNAIDHQINDKVEHICKFMANRKSGTFNVSSLIIVDVLDFMTDLGFDCVKTGPCQLQVRSTTFNTKAYT